MVKRKLFLKKLTYLIILFFAINTNVLSQKTTIYTHDNATYNSALELYDKEKFSAAQEKFAQVLQHIKNDKSEIAVDAMYYHALCGLELFNIDAENLLIKFIYAYPESPKVKAISPQRLRLLAHAHRFACDRQRGVLK